MKSTKQALAELRLRHLLESDAARAAQAQCPACQQPEPRERILGHSCAIDDSARDAAQDARATGPDPDKSTSARRLDEEQGTYRSF